MLIGTMPEDNNVDLLETKSTETNGKSLNINTLVERYHHFQSLVWPIIMIVQNIAYIVRYECNFIMYVLSQSHLLAFKEYCCTCT